MPKPHRVPPMPGARGASSPPTFSAASGKAALAATAPGVSGYHAEPLAGRLARAADEVGVEVAALFLLDDHLRVLKLAAVHGLSPNPATLAPLVLGDDPPSGVPARRRRVALAPGEGRRLAAFWQRHHVVAVEAAPLVLMGRLLGLLCVGRTRPRAITLGQRRRLSRAARQLTQLAALLRLEAAEQQTGERYQALIAHSADAIVLVSPAGAVLYASPATSRLLGYAPAELQGRDALGLLHPDDRESLHELRDRLRAPGSSMRVEFRARHRNDTWRWLEADLTNLLHEPEIQAVAATCRDLSERKRLEAELRQAQKLEAIGRLAGGVAHDFNNLITVINGFCELLLADLPHDDPRRAYAIEIAKTGEDASALVGQLLAFSRRQVMAPVLLNLNDAVMGIESMLRRLLGDRVELDIQLDPNLGSVRVDPVQMQQVIVNLAANARDAMPRGGRLRIRTANVGWTEPDGGARVMPAAGGGVLLEVSDSGSGIMPQVREHIFEPFFTTKAEGQGTGLGLATVYGIVRQSGGSVWVASRPGEGTTFTIHLPRAEARPSTPARPAPESVLLAGTETVLLVEAEPQVRALAHQVLQIQGYTVLEADSPDEALALSERYPGAIHLLLTETTMAGSRGRALAEELIAQRPALRVLYMSSGADGDVPSAGVHGTGGSFLPKPFTRDGLARRVRAALDLY